VIDVVRPSIIPWLMGREVTVPSKTRNVDERIAHEEDRDYAMLVGGRSS